MKRLFLINAVQSTCGGVFLRLMKRIMYETYNDKRAKTPFGNTEKHIIRFTIWS